MPTASQYARYREDRTTIWVSKAAAAFLARERQNPRESSGAVLDRLLTELRRARRRQPAGGGTGKTAANASTAAARGGSAGAATKKRSRRSA